MDLFEQQAGFVLADLVRGQSGSIICFGASGTAATHTAPSNARPWTHNLPPLLCCTRDACCTTFLRWPRILPVALIRAAGSRQKLLIGRPEDPGLIVLCVHELFSLFQRM